MGFLGVKTFVGGLMRGGLTLGAAGLLAACGGQATPNPADVASTAVASDATVTAATNTALGNSSTATPLPTAQATATATAMPTEQSTVVAEGGTPPPPVSPNERIGILPLADGVTMVMGLTPGAEYTITSSGTVQYQLGNHPPPYTFA